MLNVQNQPGKSGRNLHLLAILGAVQLAHRLFGL